LANYRQQALIKAEEKLTNLKAKNLFEKTEKELNQQKKSEYRDALRDQIRVNKSLSLL
jgi:hypothetical protein